MKTFAKLFAVLAFLAVGFTSCSEEDDAQVTITLDSTKIESGKAVTGAIVSDNDLKSVTLTKDGQTVAGWPITSFKDGYVIGSNGAYAIRIEGLADGSYAIRATDKDGKEDNKSFTVGNGTVNPGYETFSAELGGSGASAGSFLSISNKTVYNTSTVTANAANVEIVFDGTSLKSASVADNSAVKANGITTTFNGNATSVTVEYDETYTFETSTGITGEISITEVSGIGNATTITVSVKKEI